MFTYFCLLLNPSFQNHPSLFKIDLHIKYSIYLILEHLQAVIGVDNPNY